MKERPSSFMRVGRVAELVYAHALGACGETLGGSNPLPPILLRPNTFVLGLRRNEFCYVYILISHKNEQRYYIGYTDNLKRRLEEHNKAESGYSKRYAPWFVKTYIVFDNFEQANSFEKYLKAGSGHAFLKKRLI